MRFELRQIRDREEIKRKNAYIKGNETHVNLVIFYGFLHSPFSFKFFVYRFSCLWFVILHTLHCYSFFLFYFLLHPKWLRSISTSVCFFPYASIKYFVVVVVFLIYEFFHIWYFIFRQKYRHFSNSFAIKYDIELVRCMHLCILQPWTWIYGYIVIIEYCSTYCTWQLVRNGNIEEEKVVTTTAIACHFTYEAGFKSVINWLNINTKLFSYISSFHHQYQNQIHEV